MIRRCLLTASLLSVGCGLWPTADLDCLDSGRCMAGPGASSAAIVLGQPDAQTNLQLQLGMSSPTGAKRQGTRLFVVDSNNHRVLIWNQVPTANQPADVVLGQPDLTTNYANLPAISAATLNRPHSLASDGTRLFVADSANRRVLVWNQFPTRNGQPADFVLGQPDFTSTAAGLSARNFGDNPDVSVDGGTLFVTDRGNHRILVWTTIPTATYTPANTVLGQANMVSGMANRGTTPTAGSLSSPSGQVTIGNNLVTVADTGNHRVLAFDRDDLLMNGPNAKLVLGQSGFTTGQSNGGMMSVSAGYLISPATVGGVPGGRILVSDAGHNRLLSWASNFTSSSGADTVFGQPNFTGSGPNTGGVSGSSLAFSEGLSVYGGTQDAHVADTGNHRVLYLPDINPASRLLVATVALGQPDLTSNLSNNPGVSGGNVFGSPVAVSGGGGRLALSDSRNRRVLLWNRPPTSASDPPALALGQPDFASSQPYHGAGNVSGDGFEMPGAVWSDGERLLVADNHRVLIWKRWPTTNLQPADLVLGQPGMTTNTANSTGPAASSFWQVTGITVFDEHVYVADGYNHRVLIFNQFPTKNGQEADLVLGQSDMRSNSGGIGAMPCLGRSGASAANQVYCPQGVAKNGTHLVVSAFGDSRVMVWNRPITTNNQPADRVLGQNDLTQSITPSLPAPNTILRPVGVSFTGERLYVTDFGWNRVLYWNTPIDQFNPPADGVIGQPDLRSGLPNSGGLAADRLSGPLSAAGSPERLYIVDARNYRMIAMAHP